MNLKFCLLHERDINWLTDFIVASQPDLYPLKMQITDPKIWEDEIKSTPYSIGCHDTTGQLIGWRIFRRESDNTIYASDLSVLSKYQGQGIGDKLVRESLKAPRWNKESVHSFLRQTSYHIVANPKLIFECGYKLAYDKLVSGHYVKRFGVEESAHEILIEPVGE